MELCMLVLVTGEEAIMVFQVDLKLCSLITPVADLSPFPLTPCSRAMTLVFWQLRVMQKVKLLKTL